MKKAAVLSMLVAVVLLAAGVMAQAQQATKISRIGYLTSGGTPSAVEPLRQGLRDLGYIGGKNIVIE